MSRPRLSQSREWLGVRSVRSDGSPLAAGIQVLQALVARECECLIAGFGIFVILSLAVNAAPPRASRTEPSLYEPGGVEVVSGEVARVETLPRAGGGSRDVLVVLKTEIGDEVRVAVAPQWVAKAMGLRLRERDQIQVTGWRIVRGKPALLAAEIGKDTQQFVFRDRYGVAVWGPRRRLTPAPIHRVEPPR